MVSLQAWCWDAMFRKEHGGCHFSSGVSEIIVSLGNSQRFPPKHRVICSPTGTPHKSQHSRWATPEYGVVYGSTPCVRVSTKLIRASVVVKSENTVARSIPVEYVVGPCAGWSLFCKGSTLKCRSLRYTQSSNESERQVDRSAGNDSCHCVESWLVYHLSVWDHGWL